MYSVSLVYIKEQVHMYRFLMFTSPDMDLNQKPINFSNNKERSLSIFFCNESVNPVSWLTPFPKQKYHGSPMELYSDLIILCQFLKFP